MESLKRLEEVAKECLKDLKAIDSKVSVAEGNLSFLESKKASLTAEVAALEGKKAAIQEAIGTAEIESKRKIDDRVRELRLKEEQVTADRAELKTRLFQAEQARADADAAKEKYATLYSEYLGKLQELESKKQAILAAAQ